MTATTECLTTSVPTSAPGDDPIPFRRLLRVEWRKGIDTRSAQWLLAASAAVVVATEAIPLAMPTQTDQAYEGYLAFAALGLCILLPAVSILVLTTEWTQRTVLATFTQEPRRLRVVHAKVLSGLILGVVGVAFVGIVATAGLALSAALGRDVTWQLSASHAFGLLTFVLLNNLMGMAFGTVLLRTAPAVVLFYALPTVWSLVSFGAMQNVRDWLDTVRTFGWVLSAEWAGHVPQMIVSTAVWVLVPLLVGLVRTVRHEVV